MIVKGIDFLIFFASSSPFSPPSVMTSIRMRSIGLERQYTSVKAALAMLPASAKREEVLMKCSNSCRGIA